MTGFYVTGKPLYIDMELQLASFDSISEVNMVSYARCTRSTDWKERWVCLSHNKILSDVDAVKCQGLLWWSNVTLNEP